MGGVKGRDDCIAATEPRVWFTVRKPRAGWHEITQHRAESPNIGLVVAKVKGEARARFIADALHKAAQS